MRQNTSPSGEGRRPATRRANAATSMRAHLRGRTRAGRRGRTPTRRRRPRAAASTGGRGSNPGGSAVPLPRVGTSTGRRGESRGVRADARRARMPSRAEGGRPPPPLRARPPGVRGSGRRRRAGSQAMSPRARTRRTRPGPGVRSDDARPRGDDRIAAAGSEGCLQRYSRQHHPPTRGKSREPNWLEMFETARMPPPSARTNTHWSAIGHPTRSQRPSGDQLRSEESPGPANSAHPARRGGAPGPARRAPERGALVKHTAHRRCGDGRTLGAKAGERRAVARQHVDAVRLPDDQPRVRRTTRGARAPGRRTSSATDDPPIQILGDHRPGVVHVARDEAAARAPGRSNRSHARTEPAVAHAVAAHHAERSCAPVHDAGVGLGARPAWEAHVGACERPADVAVRLERRELRATRRDHEAPERRPARLAVGAEQPLRAVGLLRPRRPRPRRRAAGHRPGAGTAPAARVRHRPPHGPRRAPPGPAGSRGPPRAARQPPPRSRLRESCASAAARLRARRRRRGRRLALARARPSAPGTSIRSSSCLHNRSLIASSPRRNRELTVPRGRSSTRRSRQACSRAGAACTITARWSGGSAASAASTSRSAVAGGSATATSSAARPRARRPRARAASIARFTTIRWSQGPNGRRRSKRSRFRIAARKASWAMSSASAESCTTRYAARCARGQWAWKSASRSEADPRCAPRTQARSSRPARATAGPYAGTTARGP